MKLHSFSHRIMIGMSFQMKLQDITVLIASNLHWKRTEKIRNLNLNSSFSKCFFIINKVLYLFVDIIVLYYEALLCNIKYIYSFSFFSTLLSLLDTTCGLFIHQILRLSMPPIRNCILDPYSYCSDSANMYATRMKKSIDFFFFLGFNIYFIEIQEIYTIIQWLYTDYIVHK